MVTSYYWPDGASTPRVKIKPSKLRRRTQSTLTDQYALFYATKRSIKMAHKDIEKRRAYGRAKAREYRADPQKNAKLNAYRRNRAAKPENKEKTKEYNRKWREQQTPDGLTKSVAWQRARRKAKPADYLLFDAKRRADKKNVPYDISNAERTRIENIINTGKCEVTGLPFAGLEGTANPWSPSLDRAVPDLGYVDGNIRVVVWSLNMAKAGWGDDVLLTLARAIVDANR
jgi:hypothetical protein